MHTAGESDPLVIGKEVYTANCAGCHTARDAVITARLARERDVVNLVGEGLANKAIAERRSQFVAWGPLRLVLSVLLPAVSTSRASS